MGTPTQGSTLDCWFSRQGPPALTLSRARLTSAAWTLISCWAGYCHAVTTPTSSLSPKGPFPRSTETSLNQ